MQYDNDDDDDNYLDYYVYTLVEMTSDVISKLQSQGLMRIWLGVSGQTDGQINWLIEIRGRI